MRRLNEFELIQKLTKRNGPHPLDRVIEVGIGDDAAVVSISEGMRLVTACDTMVETIHFNEKTMRVEQIGYKALAVNVSDIVAMGGIPKYALVSLSIPSRYSVAQLDRLYRGLYACADKYDVVVIGGDTTSSPEHFTLGVTVMGEVEPGKACRRSAAKPGDAVFITGIAGEAAAGLHLLLNQNERQDTFQSQQVDELYGRLIAAHQIPQPSVQAGRILLSGGCGALNDLSDGLASELHEISAASGWKVILDERMLPYSKALKQYAAEVGEQALAWSLYGGEDYHLVGTVEAENLNCIRTAFDRENIPFFIIGEVTHEQTNIGEVCLKNNQNEWIRIEKKGFHHF